MPDSDNYIPLLGFDTTTLARHLSAEDEIGLIVRAHLYVEVGLNRLIESVLVNRNALKVADLKFSLKLRLARALGAIEENDQRACMVLNKLRNDFAHDLQSELTEQNESDLFKALGADMQEKVESACTPEQWKHFLPRLRLDLVTLITRIDFLRLKHQLTAKPD